MGNDERTHDEKRRAQIEKRERERLEEIYGQVWNTTQLQEDFSVDGFMAPYVGVTRKSDGAKGSLEFQHMPRFYFNFVSDK